MSLRRQIRIATLVFLMGGLAAWLLIQFPPENGKQEETLTPPIVRVAQVEMQSKRLHVHSQGQVVAHTEIDLVTEVSGRIIDTSPVFVSGGYFNKGDVLVTIDPADYDLRVAQAQAQVREARHLLMREEAEAAQAHDEWKHLGQGDPGPLSQHIPQLQEMRAKLAAAKAALKYARQLRQRTRIRAPFDGRVRNHNTGIGQYVTQGNVLGVIYSSDYAEVRLPVNTRDLAFIDVPDTLVADEENFRQGPLVVLAAEYQGEKRFWQGKIVRSEGVIDRNTGMLMLVARISDPFLRTSSSPQSGEDRLSRLTNTTALPVGLFVEALIQGRPIDRLVILPTSVVFKDDQVAVVDQHNRLRLRTVRLLRREHGQAIIQAGLTAGERVLLSGLLQPMEGLQVTPELPNTNDQASGDSHP
ncbi:HlyD family efflux transporter periplasmic adaptor subunit [Betaproteobacteria bacterium PRO5]|nr:HlyD family efflux transporter periplasmic adaptor subunit [Betaproteobacteria bacterium PRO5]